MMERYLTGYFQVVATAANHFDFFRSFFLRLLSRWLRPKTLLLLALLSEAASALAGRDRDLTRLENVPREIFKQIETTQL